MDDLNSVREVCDGVRTVFEHVLKSAEIGGTKGTCLQASILLEQALNRFADSEAVVRGGDGQGNGARDNNGAWRGHYWCEGVTRAGSPFLADITGDQFGWPSVVVLPLQEARDRYVPGDDDLCALAVDEEVERVARAGKGC